MINQQIKVLIVDDQSLVLEILSKGLSRDPLINVVGTASDGQIGLQKMDLLNPDIIILDMEMPNMNGLQFLAAMMDKKPTPTIVLSGLTHHDSKITQQVFELGAFDFLAKPQGGPRELPKLILQLLTKIRVAAAQEFVAVKKKSASIELVPKAEPLKQSILGMGAYEVSDEIGKTLKIFALGSCIGVALFCPEKNVIGLSHVVLPSSSSDLKRSEVMPGYFADTAVEKMISKMNLMGCNNSSIFAKMSGGAKTADTSNYFGIGQKNALAVKANLLKRGIRVMGEDVGKTYSRTVSVTVGETAYHLKHPEKGEWEI